MFCLFGLLKFYIYVHNVLGNETRPVLLDFDADGDTTDSDLEAGMLGPEDRTSQEVISDAVDLALDILSEVCLIYNFEVYFDVFYIYFSFFMY